MTQVHVGRQAIFDRIRRLAGYELLFRGRPDADTAVFDDGDAATASVILHAVSTIGLRRLVGQLPAYVNVTHGFLTGRHPLPPADRVVVEVLETTEIDAEVVRGVTTLRDRGYRIALDDFCHRPELEPLVELADIVKLDLRTLSEDDLDAHVALLRNRPVRLLAEKIEHREEFDRCLDRGFRLFQGYLLRRPGTVCGESVPTGWAALARIVDVATDPDVGLERLVEAAGSDVGVSYQLVRVVNSAYVGVRRRIESVREAVVILGTDAVRRWLLVIAVAGIGTDRPQALLSTALVRARMAEQLERDVGLGNGSRSFTVGLFSTLDEVLGQPLEPIVAGLHLSADVVAALLERDGPLGPVLDTVLRWEAGEVPLDAPVPAACLRERYLEAVAWANDVSGAIADAR